jgi:hypothetical protein
MSAATTLQQIQRALPDDEQIARLRLGLPQPQNNELQRTRPAQAMEPRR